MVTEEKEQKKPNVHICKDEDIKNFKEILEKYIFCPNCEAFIMKEFGCFMMFCTHCNCKFEFSTG